MIKKGYTLLSMLVCLLIISIMTTLTISKYTKVNKDDLFLYSDYIYNQTLSLVYNKDIQLESNYLPFGNSVYFYNGGIIGKAQTITLDNKELIINLGSGYAHFK